EDWVINKDNKGIRWVVVWLIPDPAPDPKDPKAAKLAIHPSLKDVPKDSKMMDQPTCKFEPHVIALRQGQTLEVKNSTPITHNGNWTGIGNRGDNKILGPNDMVKITDLKAARFPVTVACNIHPWMKGWVRVFDHPYFAVTDADGRFEIKNAPAGKCRLVVWHETGWRNQDTRAKGDPIEIKAGGTTDLGTLEMKPRKD